MEAPLDLEINELLAGHSAMRAITGDIGANSGLGMAWRSIALIAVQIRLLVGWRYTTIIDTLIAAE
jgi:hypothetical protein